MLRSKSSSQANVGLVFESSSHFELMGISETSFIGGKLVYESGSDFQIRTSRIQKFK